MLSDKSATWYLRDAYYRLQSLENAATTLGISVLAHALIEIRLQIQTAMILLVKGDAWDGSTKGTP